MTPLVKSGNLVSSAVAIAMAVVIASNKRSEKRIFGREVSIDDLVVMGSHGKTKQNAAEVIADHIGTFQRSGDGRL